MTELTICLQCAEIHDNGFVCPTCESEVELAEALIEYGRDIARYGHLYRDVYESRENPEEGGQFCLGDLSEVYSWLALAALGGVVGNLSTDAVKAIFRKIIENNSKHESSGPSYEKLAKISDEELVRFYEQVREFHLGMNNTPISIRNLIVEEMIADAVADDQHISNELSKLLFREKIKPKHKKKAALLYRAALQKKLAKSNVATKAVIKGLWQKL
jgi:hypothetical protein